MEELRDALIELAREENKAFLFFARNRDNDTGTGNGGASPALFFRELGLFMMAMREQQQQAQLHSENDSSPSSSQMIMADPENLYKVVDANANNFGDPASSLRILLQTIRRHVSNFILETTSNENKETKSLLRETRNDDLILQCWKVLDDTIEQQTLGLLHQELTGVPTNPCSHVKLKKSKERKLPCPFSIPIASSVAEGISQATICPQIIHGYDWNDTPKNTATSSSEQTWKTHRTNRFISLPQCLVLHIDRRRRYQPTETNIQPTDENVMVEVPSVLQLEKYLFDSKNTSHGSSYNLRSAIVYMASNDVGDDDDEEDAGHYVTLLRTNQQQGEWHVVDEQVTRLSTVCDSQGEEGILVCLEGGAVKQSLESLYPGFSCQGATLLVYSRAQLQQQQSNNDDFGQLVAKASMHINASLVGRRLGVRWAKNKFYRGTISSFNDKTFKHTVTYDDGDVREYNLTQKVIRWE